MDPKFWCDKWVANQIAFHQDVFHPMLVRFWDALELDPSARVFAPLCGKSKDLVWLRQRGHEVVGVELSEIAAQAFFEENSQAFECDDAGAFKRYRGDGISILCGDIFDLTQDELGSIAAIYDRAALIALPPDMRPKYMNHLRSLCAPGVRALLITLGYPPEALSPPPFLVADDEVHAHYGTWCDVDMLGTGAAKVKGVDGSETAFKLIAR